MALNKALEEMEVKRFQLSIPYLLRGYYPCYSLCVASALLVISSALAIATGSPRVGSSDAAANGTHNKHTVQLFSSFTGFCAVSVLLLMVCTLCYRVCGGSYSFNSRNVGRQVDWAYDLVKESAQCWLPWLVNCSRAERICVVAVVAVVGEVGKFLPFWSFIACAAAGWIVFLLARTFACCA